MEFIFGLLMFTLALGMLGVIAGAGFSFWISEVEPYLEKKRNLK